MWQSKRKIYSDPEIDRHEHPIIYYLTRESTIVFLIILNTMSLFLDAFPHLNSATHGFFSLLDHGCTLYFIMELLLKIKVLGFRKYWVSPWNRFDFFIILLSMPSLLASVVELQAFSVLLILRLGRLGKFFRLLRFVPHGVMIWGGIKRALQASIYIFLTLFILNLVFAMGATFLFGDLAPQYFGNPLLSSYSLFKVFTVEGWYEIPDRLVLEHSTATWPLFVRGYFMVAVLIGGILGLSLANAVFVDEMTADNTHRVEYMVEQLKEELERFHEESQLDQKEMLYDLFDELRQVRGLLEKRGDISDA